MTNHQGIAAEITWRRELLAKVGGQPVNRGVAPSLLKELGLYGGQQGIWIDKSRTRPLTEDGNGVAVAVLHTGRTYSDDLDDSGVIYHYPYTDRPEARDKGETEAVKNCHRWNVPIFVITHSENNVSLRDIYFGFVAAWDDDARVFFIEFGPRPIESGSSPEERPFELLINEQKSFYEVPRRPGQSKFRRVVLQRYGVKCAVCEVTVIDLLEAAHLVSKEDGGTDDPRNGLPLCANHHLAFDKGLFSINADTSEVVTRPRGPSAKDLGITKQTIQHLIHKPHINALAHVWHSWTLENGD
ncbi:MAG: HNH endonuclease [Chloroflexi bacterium]|nr:HNH endonuclease [Chloroflexota bacterium]